jgi:translation initiation factor 3 subunit D
MASYSWDLVFKKFQNMVFVDKREEENLMDFETLSESASYEQQPLDDDSKDGVRQLMKEGLLIKANLLQQCQSSKKLELEEDDPHEEAEDQKMIRMGYKYNLFKLSDNITLCIRSCIHFQNGDEMSNLFVLPQWNLKRQTWGKDLDMRSAVMLTQEIADNSCKFNRWTMQSIIGGITKMRFAFVMRNDSNPKSHKMVGYASVVPTAFANQINLQVSNCWAVLRDVLQTVRSQPQVAGDYLYMKEIYQPNYRLIHMVKDVSEKDSDDDSDEDKMI